MSIFSAGRKTSLLFSRLSRIASIRLSSGGVAGEKGDGYWVDLGSSRAATASKSNYELVRGWLVFNLFNSDHIVDNSLKYYGLSKQYLGPKITEKVLKATVFGQFAAGLNEREGRRTARRLADNGVCSIWNYSKEKYLHEEEDITTEALLAEKERGYHEVNNKYLKSIQMSADHNCNPSFRLAAVKLTAIVNPHLARKLNDMLVMSRCVFDQLASGGEFVTDRIVSMDTLKREVPALLDQGLDGGERGVSAVDWNSHFSVGVNIDRFLALGEKANVSPDTLSLSSLEHKQVDSFLDRLDSIGKCACDHGVRVLVDAEQTYFQTFFDHVTLHRLMTRYNRDHVTIYNTVQAYLKSSMETLLLSLATTTQCNIHCGIKLVRGAYIEQERALSRSQGCPDPTQPTKEATDASYNSCLTHLLHSVSSGQLNVVVASHNQESVQLATQTMRELKLSKTDGSVAFGQQLGMGDHLTYPLADAGYIANKVLTYGTMDDVVPFLSRRAQENRSLMANADREREIYQQEIRRRLSDS